MTQASTSHRSRFGSIIAAVGIIALILIAVVQATMRDHVHGWLIPGIAVAYILWLLSEYRITTHIHSQDTRADRYTCETYAIARFITMAAALGMGSVWQEPGLWLPIGLSVFAAGMALRAWAIATLGRAYSHRVRTPAEGQVVDWGPYRQLRHPAYSGMLLAHVGIVILFLNAFAVVALVGILLPALVRRIRVEEQHLMQMPAYQQFAAGRARIIPMVW